MSRLEPIAPIFLEPMYPSVTRRACTPQSSATALQDTAGVLTPRDRCRLSTTPGSPIPCVVRLSQAARSSQKTSRPSVNEVAGPVNQYPCGLPLWVPKASQNVGPPMGGSPDTSTHLQNPLVASKVKETSPSAAEQQEPAPWIKQCVGPHQLPRSCSTSTQHYFSEP